LAEGTQKKTNVVGHKMGSNGQGNLGGDQQGQKNGKMKGKGQGRKSGGGGELRSSREPKKKRARGQIIFGRVDHGQNTNKGVVSHRNTHGFGRKGSTFKGKGVIN